MRRLLLSITASLCLGAGLLPGQVHVPLLGVYDARSGEPIAGAVVRDTLGTEAVTTKDGVVALNFISPVGPFYLIEVRKPGYRPLHLRIKTDALTDRTEVLEPVPLGSATALPAVTVTEKYNLNLDPGLRDGFATRCASKLVTCYAPVNLWAHPSATLYDFLKKTSGTIPDCGSTINRNGTPARRQIGPGGKVLDCLKMRKVPPAGDPVCIPTYFVDGFPRGATGTTLDEIEAALDPLSVKGIEVYLAGQPAPMRYGVAGGCGAVVIWSK